MTVALPIARTTKLHQGVVKDVSALRSLQVRLGMRLLELRRLGRFGFAGTTTFSLYCEQVGLSATEGRSLADLAEASEKRPALLDAVLERGITLWFRANDDAVGAAIGRSLRSCGGSESS